MEQTNNYGSYSARGDDRDIFNPFNRKKIIPKNEVARRDTSGNLTRNRNIARQAGDIRKTYLFLYNLTMFIGFLFIFLVLAIKASSKTIADDTIEAVGRFVRYFTLVQYVESIHTLMGVVPGGPLMPFAQCTGRFIITLFLTEREIRVNAEPFVLYLYLVWSCVEIVRYPYYALRVFHVEIPALTWLRYSLFLPLYPLGGFFETMVVTQSVYFYDKTNKLSWSLPNNLNISFHLPMVLRFYLVVLLYPMIYIIMRYMWSQRKRHVRLHEIDQ